MSYLLSSILSKTRYRNKQIITPSKHNGNTNNNGNSNKGNIFLSPFNSEISSTQGTLTLSTKNNNNKKPLVISALHKRNISFFSPATSIKLTKVVNKPSKAPLPKISVTETDQTEILLCFVNGITKQSTMVNNKQMLKLKNNQTSFNKINKRIQSSKHSSAYSSMKKTRNKISLFNIETNEQLFDRFNKGTFAKLKKDMVKMHKKNKTAVLNENNRLYSTDFKIANRKRFTKDFRILDHADYDYQPLDYDKEKEKDNKRNSIKGINTQLYTHSNLYDLINDDDDDDKYNNKTNGIMTTIEDTIIKMNLKAKEELYAKWKKVIVKAADQFRRSNLCLKDLYAGKYHMTVPFQEKDSDIFFKAVKYEDNARVNRLLNKNRYLVHSFDLFHQTALHWAAKRNQYSLILLFISYGANVNAQDKYGRTPLHLASYYNCYESVLILLYEIASPVILDKGNQTPVQLSREYRVINAFKRATLLLLIHSMGKRAVFEENYRRGFLWYIENEIRITKLLPKQSSDN